MHIIRVRHARGLVRVDGIAVAMSKRYQQPVDMLGVDIPQVAVDARPAKQHVAAVNVRLPRVGVVLPPERDGDLGQHLQNVTIKACGMGAARTMPVGVSIVMPSMVFCETLQLQSARTLWLKTETEYALSPKDFKGALCSNWYHASCSSSSFDTAALTLTSGARLFELLCSLQSWPHGHMPHA